MRTSLTVVLSALGVAALVASPVVAKTVRHHKTAPSAVSVPTDAYASSIGAYRTPEGGPYTPGAYRTPEGGPYTPSMPAPNGKNRDFQAAK